jgi:hypothetical protein
MINWLKKVTGITKIEEEKQALQEARDQAIAETVRAQEEAELAKLTPKERATKKGEAWVGVLQTHVNKENLRNGFFELDWNEQFIVQLKQGGYGFDGDPEEEIVDRWFRDLCRDILADEGQDTSRGSGYINVVPINQKQSEVS